MRVAIVGNSGGTNISESFRRAALAQDHELEFFDTSEVNSGSRVVRAVYRRLFDRKPTRLKRFCEYVLARCEEFKPQLLISTGAAPLDAPTLLALGALGVRTANYSTDDPWSAVHRAGWQFRALPAYDFIFSPRRANLADFAALGCENVRYLPFGYDEDVCKVDGAAASLPKHDVVFVGGADAERSRFMGEFMRGGLNVTLVGQYWQRFAETRGHTIGQQPPEIVAALTVNAKVNLCLVRRSNRDGHVMRTFEIAALGGCMLAEDTVEHRDIFGDPGDAVLYFKTPQEAAAHVRTLLDAPAMRAQLGSAARSHIATGRHTYGDRLREIMRQCSVEAP